MLAEQPVLRLVSDQYFDVFESTLQGHSYPYVFFNSLIFIDMNTGS